MRVLIVEDETGIANFLRDGLEEESFAVDIASDGKKGLAMAMDNDYDIVLLDWMIPALSGIEVVRQIRKKDQSLPVIFLTAKDTVKDVVFALEAGANDYIKKPFQFEELLARIRVQLRSPGAADNTLRHGDIELSPDMFQVKKNGRTVTLTQKEFALLEYLLRNKGKVCTRTRIIEHVWDIHFESDTSVIDVYINFLRKKLDDENGKSFIQTVRGVGYIIRDEQ